MTSLGEGGCDLAQAHALAGLGACPVEAFRQGDGVGSQLDVRLAPFTLPLLLSDALAGVAQLGDQTRLLVWRIILRLGSSLAVRSSPLAVSRHTPREISNVMPSS